MSSEKYDDDEVIVDPTEADADDGSGENALQGALDVGKVPVKFDNEPEVPKDEFVYQLLLELTGKGGGNARLGADIVAVLDVSLSMEGDKMIEMKRAMQFVIKKLSPSDRLSVITFAKESKRECRLRRMTKQAQLEVDFMVQNLNLDDYTNIRDGLERGLKVLKDRKFTTGRSGAIMLMSDGEQNVGDATKVIVDRFPVFTFGFGTGADPMVLNDIAKRSNGGTYSEAKPGELSVVFAGCLGGLLSVLVEDVELVLEPLTGNVGKRIKVTTKINKVYAGNYPQRKDDRPDGPITVSFGNLYQKEIRTVLVELKLPKIADKPPRPIPLDSLLITCDYRGQSGNRTSTNPVKFRVIRSTTPKMKLSDATKAEIKRVEIVELMKEARALANKALANLALPNGKELEAEQKNLEAALNKVVEGQNSLDDLILEKSKPVIETLKYELDEMVKFLQTPETYKNKGRSFTCSCETSHDRQRFASRGDAEKMRCYATPRMETCIEQAKKFEEDPKEPVPTVAEDEKQEVAADPLATISPSLDYYLQTAIDALVSIRKIISQKP